MTRRHCFTIWEVAAVAACAVVVLSALFSGALRGLSSSTPPPPPPALSPTVGAPDPMRQCLERGGVQLVYINGAWSCVTADQAG